MVRAGCRPAVGDATNPFILNQQPSTSAGHEPCSTLGLQRLCYFTTSWAPEIQPGGWCPAGPLGLALCHRTRQHRSGWATSRGHTGRFPSLRLPRHVRWGHQVLPILEQGPKHGWWAQKGTSPALQHSEVGHGEEKRRVVVPPAPGFQLWPLGCKTSAK